MNGSTLSYIYVKGGHFMLVHILEKYFGISPDTQFMIGSKNYFVKDQQFYTLVQVTDAQEELLIELYEISERIAKLGDRKVLQFVLSTEESFLVTEDDQDYVLLRAYVENDGRNKNTGRQLAKFHERGSRIDYTPNEMNQLGEWKNYWEKRLEQLERMWLNTIQKEAESDFERLFVESFPYYLGLAENSIQYIVDTELDVEMGRYDGGTICYQQFNEQVWSEQYGMKHPFEWVYDHPSRDVAEWIRSHFWKNTRTYANEMKGFLDGYQSIRPLSLYSYRLIYARLLFPLYYFRAVENYFLSPQQESFMELYTYTRDTGEYERFLSEFYQIVGISDSYLLVQEWLNTKQKS